MWNTKTKRNRAGGSQRGHPRQRCNIGIWSAVRIIALIWSHQSGSITVNIVKHWNVLFNWHLGRRNIPIFSSPRGVESNGKKSAYFTTSLCLYCFIIHTIIFFNYLHFSHQPVRFTSSYFRLQQRQASSIWERARLRPHTAGTSSR